MPLPVILGAVRTCVVSAVSGSIELDSNTGKKSAGQSRGTTDAWAGEPFPRTGRGGSGEDGEIGDGKIFVLPMDECVRIRTGERGQEAI